MRRALLVSLLLVCCGQVRLPAQDVKAVPDTVKIPEALRSGPGFGPNQFNFISWPDRVVEPAPDAARMTRYADTPVSYAYGLAEIGIPLYTIKTRSLNVPIALSYDSSGIRPEEVSGIVGLGWSLSAGGVITREVVGRPDEVGGNIPPEYTNPNQVQSLALRANSYVDTDYDRYSYNFCGHTGSFYFLPDALGTVHVVPTEPTELTISRDNSGFLIVDKDGTQYRFSQQETSGRFLGSDDPNAPINNNSSASYDITTATAWHLTKIRSIDGKEVITIAYKQLASITNVRHSYYRSVAFPYIYLGSGNYLTNFQGGNDPTPIFQTLDWSNTTTNYWYPNVPQTITFPGGKLSFHYTGYSPTTTSTKRWYPEYLDTVTLQDAGDNTIASWTFATTAAGDLRLLLESVTARDKNATTTEKWTFDYNSPSTNMAQNSVDIFGYYNGGGNPSKSFLRPFNDNNTLYFTVANRNHNANLVGALSLSTITTASGNRTKYFYSSNSVPTSGLSDLFSSNIEIGQRIFRISTYDLSSGTETLVRQRTFTYYNPDITIPVEAFQSRAFISTSEYNAYVNGMVVGNWYGYQSPMRLCSIVYCDQSNLPGLPLEGARIFYGKVMEEVAGPAGETVRTEWEYSTYGAVSGGGGGTPWTASDTHDNTYCGSSGNHFGQRVPPIIPRGSGSQSNSTVPLGYHYRDQNRPQLAEPSRITRYRRLSNGQYKTVSQSDFTYDTRDTLVQTGLHVSMKLSVNVSGYERTGVLCIDDFDQQQVDRKIIYRRLRQRVDKEYIDDSNDNYFRTVKTTYAYDYSPTGRSSLSSGNTYTEGQPSHMPAMGAVLSARQETVVFDNDNTRPYLRCIIFPDELAGVSGCSSWASSLLSAGYRSPVGEETVCGTGSSAVRSGRYITWGQVPVYNWSSGSSSTSLLKPSNMQVYRSGTSVGPNTTISYYDIYGNPVQVSTDGRPVTTYVWGYGGLRPVLEVAGGNASQVYSAVGGTALNSIASGTPTASQLTSARTSLMLATNPKKHISWYLYDLFFGIIQSYDVSGRKTIYTYDNAGRLSYIQDENGNRISSYAYALTNGGSGTPNSINTYTHTTSGSSATAGIRDVAYFDGLGRTVQTIAVGAATSSKDLITPVVPDFLDREDAQVYLPYPASGTAGAYRSSAVSAQTSHYGGSSVKAYTENTYEQSSRDRITSSSLPGFTDATSFASKASEANTVLKLSYTPGSGNSAGTISAAGYYAVNRFTVTTTTGPDGSQTAVYTDEFGTPVLERVKLNTSTWADTYYIKDVLGRVVCVVPPDVAAGLSSSSSGVSAANCYTYAYDGRDRVVRRQLPGCAPETITYNAADQPLTRTRLAAGSTSVNEVFTTTYDTFFRPTSETYKYGTNTAVTLAEYWYDVHPSGVPSFSGETGYVTSQDSRVWGLKTAERFALLPAGVAPSALTASNTATKEYRAFYYDAWGRVVQLARTNAQGGTDRISTSYGFAGNVLKERQNIQPGSGATRYKFDRTWTYDARLRLTNVTATLNGGTTASLAFTYNDLQQTASISRGNSAAETTTFSYTLQGWPNTTMSTSWEEVLFYASPAHPATSGTPGKAGLVTEWRQQQKGTSATGATTAESFAYTYDLAGRLKGSARYLGTATSTDNGLTEQSISYNLDGNLTALTRRGASGTATQTLSFSYNGPMRTTWTYDNHGNVTADPQSGMFLAWNVLDMPRTLTSGSASTQRSYLADGTLAQIYDGSTTRLYVGDMVFTRTGTTGTPALESAAWEGGRLISGSGTGNLLYYVTDHLGSVRVVKDGSGTVRQRFDYYPYGSVSRVYTNSGTTDNSVKRYRFGGKEIAGTSLTDLAGTGAAPGAPYLDFGARLYSPGTATWLSVDPMAEKYYGYSPYAYCAASPMNLVDPTGSVFFPFGPIAYYVVAKGLEKYASSANYRTVGYAMQHPIVALYVGRYDSDSRNISTIAGNYTINLSRSIRVSSEEGSLGNAFRHVLWQSIISRDFGEKQAERIGNAHEKKSTISLMDNDIFGNIGEADAHVDLLNNIIGRELGNKSKKTNKDLVKAIVDYMYDEGLWVAHPNGDDSYVVHKKTITNEQYQELLSEIESLDNYGKKLY